MAQQSGSGTGAGLNQNLASALSYIPIVGLVFLLIEPYSRNSTVRFHAFQSLFLCVVSIVVQVLFAILSGIMYMALWGTLSSLVSLAIFVIAVVAAVKAFQGSTLEVPVIADYAHRYA